MESKEKHLHWKHGCDAAMVWIKEKNKELDGMDDLESSLVILEEAASKFEVGISSFLVCNDVA